VEEDLSIVLAFDGDEAGQRASLESFLSALDLSATETGFLRAYCVNHKPYHEAITLLSNPELADELAMNTDNQKIAGAPEWYTDMYRENREACLAEIAKRSRYVNDKGAGRGFIKDYNRANSITDVLSSYGVQAAPGRSVRCPKHDDSSPSLSISKDNGRAYCFNQDCELWHDGYGVDSYELNKIMGSEPTG